jgi:predicted small metal-binding protein
MTLDGSSLQNPKFKRKGAGKVEKGGETMPSIKCKDVGMKCDFQVEARTDNELVNKFREHISKVHNVKTITPDMFTRIRKAIKK